jgi:spore cortex biosynthesis protein YabQ
MDISIPNELRNFACSMGYGAIIVQLYDLYRMLRILWNHSTIAVAIEDLLFWFMTGCIIFHMMYTYDYGRVRFYFFLGMGIGMLSYYYTFSRFFLYVVKKVKGFAKNLLKNERKTDKM